MTADIAAKSPGPAATAAEALRLVGNNPSRAIELADQLISDSMSREDPITASTAWRARALAHRELRKLDTALSDIHEAIRLAEQAGSRQAAAEAQMSLVSVHAERGEMRAALRASERAAAGLRGLPAARMRVQRGAMLCRLGQFTEAMDEFRAALPVLRRGGDQLWEARALENRGNARAYQGELRDADADLRRAESLFLHTGHHLYAADSVWNRGFVAARFGDVPLALTHFDTAEARYAEQGVPAPEIYLDRCDVLLSVGLHAEALASAENALEATAGSNRSSLAAEAHLSLAQAALAGGDRERARSAAREAVEMFQAQDRESWATVARYVLLRCEDDTTPGSEEALRDALETADELARAGWAVQELDARIIAARIALRRGDTVRGRYQLEQASHAKRTGPMEVRTRAWHAEALLRLAGGDRTGAEHALRAGIRALDQHRATLGATELRVHTAVHGEELAKLGLQLALADGAPVKVLRWIERWRAGALRWRPVRPPDDSVLADLLAELRRITAREEQQRLNGQQPSSLRRERQAVERQVLTRTRRSIGSTVRLAASAMAISPEALSGALGDRSLVEYLAFNGQLLAVTVRQGRVRLHELGAAAAAKQALAEIRFALRNVAAGPNTAAKVAARELLEKQARQLDSQLLAPVLDAVGDSELVLVPSTTLHDVPWALLPSCAGRAVSVVPSATLWARANELPATVPDGRVTLVGGPGLANGYDEVHALAGSYPSARLVAAEDATAANVLLALDGATVAHIAAHGTVRADNPFFSALQVFDGPLTVFDLERLAAPPALVVLPACQSGVTVARPGDEILGLSAALLALGSRALVATVAPVPDHGTQQLMMLLHERLRAGEPPAQALAAAQHAVRDSEDHDTFAAAAAFTCYGAS
jgi:CHAT domain-containing protein